MKVYCFLDVCKWVRLILFASIIITLLDSCSSLTYVNNSEVYFNSYRKGYWGKWNGCYKTSVTGTPDCFVFYETGMHPSWYRTRIYVDGLTSSYLKKLPKNEWRTFSGRIEFQSGISNVKDACNHFVVDGYSLTMSGKYSYSIASSIKFRKEKNYIVFNVYFEDVGIGLEFPIMAILK